MTTGLIGYRHDFPLKMRFWKMARLYLVNGGIAILAVTAFFSFSVFAAARTETCEPFKGLVLWPDEAKDNPACSDAISLEFSYCLPCDVATGLDTSGETILDWRRIDALLSDIASRRHQAIIRFRYAYPGEKLNGVRGATAVPAFIKRRADYRETFAGNPGGDGPTYYPDWSCAALENFTLAFYRAFAERYDADPRLAFVQVGFGHWAEYHTSGTRTVPGRNFPTLDFQRRFFRLLDKAFKHTPWMVSIDAAARKSDYSPAVELAREGLRFGLFDDSFMCDGHDLSNGDGWNERDWQAFGTEHWKTAPCGGEISYYKRSDQRNFLSPAGIHGVTWENAATKYHITFMIANDSVKGRYATRERFLAAQRACGYRFAVNSAKNTDGGLAVEIQNTGVAPFYHDATVAVDGKRAAGSVRGLLPGQSRRFFVDGAKPDGSIEIVSDKFLGGMSIRLNR